MGTPKGRLSKLEQSLSQLPWQHVCEGVEVKLLPQTGEVYVLAQSQDRMNEQRTEHAPTAIEMALETA